MQYSKLNEECLRVGEDLSALDKCGRQMMLSAPDLLTLTETLNCLHDRHARIAASIKVWQRYLLLYYYLHIKRDEINSKTQFDYSHCML